jgi:hypothetical protein
MKPRNGAIVALLVLATCNEEAQKEDFSNIESDRAALGKVPPSEVAVWQKVGSSTNPEGRYLQAAAFDETRKVFVMFGGTNTMPNMPMGQPNQETWEWSPTTGKWTNRTSAGTTPDARSGAAIAFDSARGKFVMFGGRAGSGFNFEDTWEWDPATGTWTEGGSAGGHPSARSQHSMVFDTSTGKVILFGGGRSDAQSTDASGISVSLGDTWEYDPVKHTWKTLTASGGPSARHDFGMVWDSARKKVVLFAGISIDIPGVAGVPKQDTWEWDSATGAWAERTVLGSKPAQRYAHAMAYDSTRKKVVVFGGLDIASGGSRNDLWDWDPTTGAWTQRLTGNESGIPSARMYSSMVYDEAHARLELVAGASLYDPYGGTGGKISPGMGYGLTGSRDVWELDPVTPVFTDRTAPLDVPSYRYNQSMAFNPSTGKTYLFGGYDYLTGTALNDLWEWDGKTWAPITVEGEPPARTDAGFAYDPARKSLILYGGVDYSSGQTYFDDTWEWSGSTKKWTLLKTAGSPGGLAGPGMVTDTTRNKILLFGGMASYNSMGPGKGYYYNPQRNEVWEWDGALMTWTNRTPPATNVPMARSYPLMAYDEGRQKLFLYDGVNFSSGSPTAFWEWDPISAGWAMRDTKDSIKYGYNLFITYDSIRRRVVMLTDPYNSSSGMQETWEMDTKAPTLYIRQIPNSPGGKSGASMVFDSIRGVAIVFGGTDMYYGFPSSETWEYKVTNLGNGEGCNAASVAACASGFCVEGVCCEAATCTGACKSCNVAGSEGTCVMAKAGTEVPGSCSEGQACDGSGNCQTKNGQPCTSAANCASGFCADGVCCDSACTGACTSCSQKGFVGICSPYTAGTDPQNECGQGTGVCKSTCDGVGSCAYPQYTVSCGDCMSCDGNGACQDSYSYDPFCSSYGGSGGYMNTGGKPYPTGGTGGYVTSRGGSGGSGGYTTGKGGAGGTIIPKTGGAGGTIIPSYDGAAGTIVPNNDGAAGSIPSLGGSGGVGTTARGGSGGSTISANGGNSGNRDGGVGDGGKTNLSKSGCDCALGHAEQTTPGLTMPFLVAGIALLWVRRRRQRRR